MSFTKLRKILASLPLNICTFTPHCLFILLGDLKDSYVGVPGPVLPVPEALFIFVVRHLSSRDGNILSICLLACSLPCHVHPSAKASQQILIEGVFQFQLFYFFKNSFYIFDGFSNLSIYCHSIFLNVLKYIFNNFKKIFVC